MLSDINRSEDYFTYEFAGGEDKDKFNEFRFSNDGRLYFEAPFPNFENPTDNGASNRYDVIVKVEDQHGDSTQEMISVTISDINDKPVITSLGWQLDILLRSQRIKHKPVSIYHNCNQ